MSFCIICFLRRLHRSGSHWHTDPGQQYPSPDPSSLVTELEDSRKFSLSSLMALLAILALSGSKALQPVALIFLIYITSLHLAIDACFLHNYPTLSRFLHVIPLLGTSSMAGVMLVSTSQSLVIATVGLLLGALPLVAIVVHHGARCGGASAPELPVQMQDMPGRAAAATASADAMPAASN